MNGPPSFLLHVSFQESWGLQFPSPGIISNDSMESDEEFAANLDYIGEIPNECLVYIFQFLGTDDYKRCSLVCKRWLLVDGQKLKRQGINAFAIREDGVKTEGVEEEESDCLFSFI
ncbi:hypothetical protein SLA2020_466970 [Shorea laevis]